MTLACLSLMKNNFQRSWDNMQKRVHIFVSGRVQGVFFRAETKSKAHIHNLSGWVRNLQDGRVETVFEGEEEDVEKMAAWCKMGPDYASVQNIEIHEEPVTGEFDSFTIRYS